MRTRTLAVAFVLIASVASSAFADCVTDLVMSAKSQMACCDSDRGGCDKGASAADCCKAEGQRQQHFTQLSAPKVSPHATTPASFVGVVIAIPSPNRIRASQFVCFARALHGSPPPLYLLSGSFLI